MSNEIKLFGVEMDWLMTIENVHENPELLELLGKDFQIEDNTTIDIILIPLVTGVSYHPQCYPKTIEEADKAASNILQNTDHSNILQNTDHSNLFRMDSGLLSYLMCPLYRVICNKVRELCKHVKYSTLSHLSQVFYQDNFEENIYNFVNNNMIWDFLHVYINIRSLEK